MIYITIPYSDMPESNVWVQENLDPQGDNTFIQNFRGYCMISITDKGSDYCESMKVHFSRYLSDNKPDLPSLPNDGV